MEKVVGKMNKFDGTSKYFSSVVLINKFMLKIVLYWNYNDFVQARNQYETVQLHWINYHTQISSCHIIKTYCWAALFFVDYSKK